TAPGRYPETHLSSQTDIVDESRRLIGGLTVFAEHRATSAANHQIAFHYGYLDSQKCVAVIPPHKDSAFFGKNHFAKTVAKNVPSQPQKLAVQPLYFS